MANIQILELRSVEVPIKDLSYEEAGSIQGGDRVQETITFLQDFYEANNLSQFYGSFGEFYSQLLAIYDEPDEVI